VQGIRDLFGIPPERRLGTEDLAAYGLDSVADLLEEVAAENGESVDEPIILVNGERTAGLGSVADLPPEALARIDVLPRGAGTKIGESATRRVYNIVLKRMVDTLAVQAAVRASTEWDAVARRGSATATHIRADRRINLALRLRDEDRLLEADRNVVQPPGAPAELGRFRTLRPQQSGGEASLAAADRLAPWLAVSGELRVKTSERESWLGLSPLRSNALEQLGRSTDFSANLALNGEAGRWLVSGLASYDSERQRVLTDRINPADPSRLGQSRTFSSFRSAAVGANLTGPLAQLPAGALRLTVGGNLSRDELARERTNLGAITTDETDRQWTRGLNAALELPITSRARGETAPIGDITATAEWGVSRTGDFDSLSRRTLALSWQPAERFRVFASFSDNTTPPSLASRSAPRLETPGVRVLDPRLGTTVEVTEIRGGNPELAPNRSRDSRMSLMYRPLSRTDLRINLEYIGSQSRNLVGGLPALSEAVIAAFPERFVRGSTGSLVSVDVRPVQFDRLTERRLRTGLNFTLPLSRSEDRAKLRSEGAEKQDDEASSSSFGRSRLQLALNHAFLLESRLVIRPELAAIDLLSPDAIGLGGAGRPRHQLDGTLGYSERGLGIRMTGQYLGATRLALGDGADRGEFLRFSSLTTFGVRAFVEGRRLLPSALFLRNSRLTLSVLNAGGTRQRVVDSFGVTPIAYQPAYRDALGRSVEIGFRKVF
jgi:hypothetical protein